MIELSGFYGNQLIELLRYIEKDFINTDKIENKKSSVDELIDLMGENIIEYK